MQQDNKDLISEQGEFDDYSGILQQAVAVIEHARTEIAKQMNVSVSSAYWQIGQILHDRKVESGYGDSVVRRLSADLKERYPKMGVSPRQLWNMKKFYERYAGHNEKVLRSVALFHWFHNLLLPTTETFSTRVWKIQEKRNVAPAHNPKQSDFQSTRIK